MTPHPGCDLDRSSTRGPFRRGARRSGTVTLWVILFLPLLLIGLCLVLEVGNLWLARLELEDAMEAAALAAVEEWALHGSPTTTLPARNKALAFATANTVRGIPVQTGTVTICSALVNNDFGSNYNAANTNENDQCLTSIVSPPPPPSTVPNLIFGGIDNSIPSAKVFRADESPICSEAQVLIDATSGASLDGVSSWGINVRNDPSAIDDNYTVIQVILDLRASGLDPDAVFDVVATPPVISTVPAGGGSIYQFGCPAGAGGSQSETSGIDSGALVQSIAGTQYTWANSQVAFVFDTTLPYVLTINFSAIMGDSGLAVGDRIRFGAKVANLGTAPNVNDGDAVGAQLVKATVLFAVSAIPQGSPVSGFFYDSDYRTCTTGDTPPVDIDPQFPANAPYVLPEPTADNPGDDNQSYVRLGSFGVSNGREFGVRAEAVWNVPSLCASVFGCCFPFQVRAEATAMFTCEGRCPRLVRISSFVCP